MRTNSRVALVSLALAGGTALTVSAASAGPLDLDDTPEPTPAGTGTSSYGAYVPPPPSLPTGHAYSLAECLALADRNHPNLWAARARLAYVHAQLDEATWVPFSQFTANFGGGVLPPIYGTVQFGSSLQSARNLNFLNGLDPIITST